MNSNSCSLILGGNITTEAIHEIDTYIGKNWGDLDTPDPNDPDRLISLYGQYSDDFLYFFGTCHGYSTEIEQICMRYELPFRHACFHYDVPRIYAWDPGLPCVHSIASNEDFEPVITLSDLIDEANDMGLTIQQVIDEMSRFSVNSLSSAILPTETYTQIDLMEVFE